MDNSILLAECLNLKKLHHCSFLCSNHSSYMTGSIVKIDGVGN